MKLIQLSVKQWAEVQDNPIQRDTVKHAMKAVRAHLSAASPTHATVAAALLPDGTLIKLDGHTRSELWMTGKLESPSMVDVAVYPAASIEETIELYKHFDSTDAAENAGDRLSGAFRFHDIVPKYRLLPHGGITSALNIIYPGVEIYEQVGQWKTELVMLDDVDASTTSMPSTLIAAALLTLRKHGARALDFWRLYAAGGGSRIDGMSCGVDELTRIVADLRARGQLGNGGSVSRQNQVGRALSCCDAWLSGRGYTVGAKTTDIKKYLNGNNSKRA